jgi:hypothetical protein
MNKALEAFAAANGLKVIPIRYRHQFGYCKRKGYDLVKEVDNVTTIDSKCEKTGKVGYVIASFEPIDNLDGHKWYVRNVGENYQGERYISRISQALKFIDTNSKTVFIHI